MFEKLEEITRKFELLEEKLAQPDVLSDRELFLKLTKEYSELSEIVTLYQQRKKKTDEIKDVSEMLESESDSEMKEMMEIELESLNDEVKELDRKLFNLLNPPDPYDKKNVILEIRAGTGGAEAGLFASELFRMYTRYGESKGWNIEVLSLSQGELDGFKEVIALISGKRVYGTLKYESGVHRVQRVPVTEASGRIHTSAVTVAVLPEAEDVEVEIDPNDLKIDVYRSSGPGGQSVNTTDSAVRITHIPTGLVVTCQDEKSQHKNKAKALKILKSRLLDKARQEQEQKIAKERRQMVSTGDRSAKIRTYNFPQNRVSDHRINLTLYKLNQIMEGDLDEIISALQVYYQTKRLQQSVSVSNEK